MKHQGMNMKYFKLRIIRIGGPCASGKTRYVIQLIQTSKLIDEHRKILFVSPSLPLCNEIYTRLAHTNMKCQLINSETSSYNQNSVGQDIIDSLDFYKDQKNVCVIITAQSYDSIPNSSIEGNGFQVVYDESPSKSQYFELILDRHEEMGAIFNFSKNHGRLSLKTKYRTAHDSIKPPFNDIRNHTLNNKRDVYPIPNSKGENFTKYKVGQKNYQSILVKSLPKLNYFPDRTIILTADKNNCDYHNMYHDQIETKEIIMDNRIKNKKAKIHCFQNKTINSTSFKKNHKDFVMRVFNHVKHDMKKGLIFRNKAEKTVDDNGNMYYPTTNEPFKLPELNKGWIDIPANIHGVNAYSNLHGIFLLGTLNPPPRILKSLREDRGMSASGLYKSTVVETYHQMVMRTSLRDPECDETVNIYMIDKETAEYLKETLEYYYDMDVEIIYHKDFDSIEERNEKNTFMKDAMEDSDYQRCCTIVRKANRGKIKNKEYELEILRLSNNGKNKSNPEILKLDEEHRMMTGEKL